MKGIWPWVIGGAVLIGGYLFIIKPLQNPTTRKVFGGLISGDKEIANKSFQEALRDDPTVAAKLKAKDPQAYNKIMAGHALYARSGYRY